MNKCDSCGKSADFLFPYGTEELCEPCFDPIAERLTEGEDEEE